MKRMIVLLAMLAAALAHAGDSVKPVSPGSKSGTSTSGNKSGGGGATSGGESSSGGTHSGGGKPADPATRVDISGNRPARQGGYNNRGESLERPKDQPGPIKQGGGSGPSKLREKDES